MPESESIAKALNEAMSLIEDENPILKGVLPKGYLRIPDDLLVATMKVFADVDFDRENGDVFGKVYEFFLGKFASSEGQKGGEFYTPTCLVKLLVEIMKPFHGNVYDPACGSGGMFVQTAEFAKRENKDEDKWYTKFTIRGVTKHLLCAGATTQKEALEIENGFIYKLQQQMNGVIPKDQILKLKHHTLILRNPLIQYESMQVLKIFVFTILDTHSLLA